MQRSQSGAANVSFLWIVFLIVLVIFFAGFTYIAWKDKADTEKSLNAAVLKEKEATQKAIDAQQKLMQLSEGVGFREEGINAASNLAAIKEKIDLLKGKFPDNVSSDVSDLERSIDTLVAICDQRKKALDEKSAALDSEIETRHEAQANLKTIEQQKNARIQELEGQLNDEQQRSAQQKEEDNKRIANLQSQLDDMSNKLREATSKAESAKQVAEKEISTLKARLMAQAKKLQLLKEPDLPDGKVVAAGTESRLVYIDIGGRDGLTRGTRFDVYRYGKGGELIRKGRIEVRDVDKDSAMCGVLEEVDEMDPIVKGDVVANPLFSRNMKRTFVLLGRFPSSMNKAFITDRLKALGNSVEDKVSSRTDFLVLGEKEQGEFAQELTESNEYKLASKLGVQILRLDDIWSFVKY